MKFLLCLVLIQICFSLGDSEPFNNFPKGNANDYGSHGHQEEVKIERPCSFYDVNCIRRYFAYNSQCSPVHGPAPDPLMIKSIPMFIPHVNITFTLNFVEVKGLNNFRIKEFYINRETGRLVLEVEFLKLSMYSPFTVLTFQRKGKEPLVMADYASIEYKDLSLTLTAPHVKDINLSEAQVFTYIADSNPKQSMGPIFTESQEPQVKAAVKPLIEKLGSSLQEAFVTKGPILMSAFVQNSICSY